MDQVAIICHCSWVEPVLILLSFVFALSPLVVSRLP